MTTTGAILAYLGVTMIIIAFIWSYKNEKKKYNHGQCPLCGGKLEKFGETPDGSRGYMCKRCRKYTVWLTWHGIEDKK